MLEQYGEADCSYSKSTLKEVSEFFNDGYVITTDNITILICKIKIESQELQGDS